MTLHQCGAPSCATLTPTATEFHAEVNVPGAGAPCSATVRACCASHLRAAIDAALEGARQRGFEIDAEDEADTPSGFEIIVSVSFDGVDYYHADPINVANIEPGAGFGAWHLRTYGGFPGPILRIRRTEA